MSALPSTQQQPGTLRVEPAATSRRGRFQGGVVLFDLDDTLRFSVPSAPDIVLAVASQCGLALVPEARRRGQRWLHQYWAESPELLHDLAASKGVEDEYFWARHLQRYLSQVCTEPAPAVILHRIFARARAEFRPGNVVPPGATHVLRELRAAGYRLGCVSNRRERVDAVLEAIGVASFFELAVSTADLGVSKPDPMALLIPARRLEARAEDIAFVGDNPLSDVLCAERAGMWPVLLDLHGVYPEAEGNVARSFADLPLLLCQTAREPEY